MIPKNLKATYVVVVVSMLVTASCNENSSPLTVVQGTHSSTTKSVANGRIASYSFDGTEGDPIDLTVAHRWIANYVTKNNNLHTAHFFGNRFLLKTLSQPGSMGIRFYYSISDSGNNHLLAVPATGDGNDFSVVYQASGLNSPVDLAYSGSQFVFTGAEADSLSSETAKHLIDNYKVSNASGVEAHFFGHEIIRQILSENNCVGIRCYYALNDAGVQQLLLVGVSSTGVNILPSQSIGGRVTDNGTIADVSSPCPTYCSGK